MIKIKIADTVIDICNKYSYIENMCRNYIVKSDLAEADFSVEVNDIETARESITKTEEPGYLESLAVYRKIAEKMPSLNGFLMHGVILDFDGVGIAFLARSGVGKSTHTMNWKKVFREHVTIVNGDKPLIKIVDGIPYAYGTPWAGKEKLETNTRTRLQKICFIERDENNSCIPFHGDVFKKILPQIYRSDDSLVYLKTLELVNTMTESTEQYIIKCNKDEASASVAKNAMLK